MTDELDLLRRQRPDPPRPSEVTLAHARSELAEVIAAAGSSPSTPAERMHAPARTGPGGSRGRVARLLIAAAVIGLLAAGAALLRSGPSAQPALAAGVVLERLAQVAAKQPRTVPAPGQYLYTESQGLTGADTVLPGGRYCQARFRQHRENWIAADGEGLVRETDGPAHYATAQEAAACGAIPQVSGTTNSWAAPQCLSIDPIPLAGLPRDPGRLRARLLTGRWRAGRPGLRRPSPRSATSCARPTRHPRCGPLCIAPQPDCPGSNRSARSTTSWGAARSRSRSTPTVSATSCCSRRTRACCRPSATSSWDMCVAPMRRSAPRSTGLPTRPRRSWTASPPRRRCRSRRRACGVARGVCPCPDGPNDSVMVGSGEAALGRAR